MFGQHKNAVSRPYQTTSAVTLAAADYLSESTLRDFRMFMAK